MATVAYVVRPEFVFTSESIFQGRVRAVQVPLQRAIDIDTLHDFQIAEYLLSHANQY
jgi:N-acylneuraminate cytidylyltransferase